MLKPQDILVTLKLLVVNDVLAEHSFASIAEAVAMSVSETHASVKRATQCHLLSHLSRPESRRGGLPQVATSRLSEESPLELTWSRYGMNWLWASRS